MTKNLRILYVSAWVLVVIGIAWPSAKTGQPMIWIIPAATGLLLMIYGGFKSYFNEDKVRQHPIVHVWKHNNITRVMPHVDWELWHQLQERKKLAGTWNEWSRPDSDIVILFSDEPSNLFTGTMTQCQAFLRGCRVEKSEMQIYICNALGFSTAWKIVVYDTDYKLPID